jgi:hypothetical protein
VSWQRAEQESAPPLLQQWQQRGARARSREKGSPPTLSSSRSSSQREGRGGGGKISLFSVELFSLRACAVEEGELSTGRALCYSGA